jgi:hypothetical protein
MYAQNPAESTSHDGSGTMRQWACSKRAQIPARMLAESFVIKHLIKWHPEHRNWRGAACLASIVLIFQSHIGAFSSQPPEEMKLLFLNEIDAQNFIFQ